MAYGGHPTALSGELSRHGARNSNTEIFENPIYESRPVYTRDRLRNVTDFLDGPVLRPENQRVILERLFEAKWDNAAEHRQRYETYIYLPYHFVIFFYPIQYNDPMIIMITNL